jgi:hypothetical protein
MMAIGSRIGLFVALWLGLAAPSAAFEQILDDTQAEQLADAISAHQLGDFPPALELFHKLAEQGVAEAQFYMGFMHAEGQGLPHDYTRAADWYTLAAHQGHPQAQNYLGLLYYEGRGITKSFRDAFIYFELAAADEYADAENNRLIVARKMNSAQITEAQKAAAVLINEYRSKVPKVDLPRRTASGVVINSNGAILTHAEAARNCGQVSVRAEELAPRPAQILAIDEFNNVAVLRADGLDPGVPLRGPALGVGDSVTIQGFGLNSDKELVPRSVAAMVTNDPALYRVDTRFVQLDSLVAPTFLGAPVFDSYGQFAGIMVPGVEPDMVASLRDAPGRVGFAVRREVASLLLDLNSYAYDIGSDEPPNAEDASLQMRNATVIIECWQEEEPSPEQE